MDQHNSAEVGLKTCSLCKAEKPTSAFFKHTGHKDGLRSQCKKCEEESKIPYRKKWWKRNRRRLSKKRREAYASLPIEVRRHSAWTKALRKNYKLSPEDYSRLLANQEGKCAICGAEKSGPAGWRLHVDHCHGTGKIRGLLCQRCNQGIERIETVPDWTAKALSYLNGCDNNKTTGSTVGHG